MRWLCDLVGYGDGQLRRCSTSGGVMANFIAMALVRDVHLPRAERRRQARRGARARRRPRLRLRPDALLDRPGARRARLPARDAGRRPGRRAASASTARRSPRPSRGPRRRSAPVRDRRRRRLDEHGLRRPRSPSSPTLADARGPVAPRRRGLRRRRPAVGAGRGRVPGLELADRVTVDPHKWFFQAYDIGGARGPRRAALRDTFGDRSARVLPRRRGPAGRGRRRPRRRPRRPAQLLQARLRGDPPVARAEAVG